MIFAYILYAVGLESLAIFSLALFLMSIVRLYLRDYAKIVMEEKVKAYSALLNGMMGRMTDQAIRESMGSDSSKPN